MGQGHSYCEQKKKTATDILCLRYPAGSVNIVFFLTGTGSATLEIQPLLVRHCQKLPGTQVAGVLVHLARPRMNILPFMEQNRKHTMGENNQ